MPAPKKVTKKKTSAKSVSKTDDELKDVDISDVDEKTPENSTDAKRKAIDLAIKEIKGVFVEVLEQS